MNIHKNARLTLARRIEMVRDRAASPAAAAGADRGEPGRVDLCMVQGSSPNRAAYPHPAEHGE